MKKFLLFLALLTFVISKKSVAQVNMQDSLALVDLYNSTNGTNWVDQTNWLNGPVGNWFGVTIEADRVTQISLNSNFLSGTLPSSIGNLTALKYVNIAGNSIGGNIPETIGDLVNLEALYTGSFSWDFESGGAGFTGEIPASIGNLTMLKYLYLGRNKLTGSIPASIGNLTNLIELDLEQNFLAGNIPAVFSNFSAMRIFAVGVNQLSGPIPPELCTLPNLVLIDVFANKFTFEGMECIGVKDNPPGSRMYYYSQYQIPITNNNPVLSVSAGGTLSNNTYTWYKDNGAAPYTTKPADSTLTLTEPGTYWGAITNSLAPQLTLYTDTIEIASIILPLQWLNFTVKNCSGSACLQWQTDHEQNVSHFEIERSEDGKDFEKIGVTQAKNTSGKHIYNAIDNSPRYGKDYYRVKQVDFDGKFTYSTIEFANFYSGNARMITPNPFRNFIQLKSSEKAEKIVLYSITGQIIQQWQNVYPNTPLNVSHIQKGVYIIKIIRSNSEESIQKLIKE